MEVGFSYGCLSDSLEKQANRQGLTLGTSAKYLDDCKNAVNQLIFDFLTDSQKDQITQKIHKKVIKSLKKIDSQS